MKIFAQPCAQALADLPEDRELVYHGVMQYGDWWWGESSHTWLELLPVHIRQPVSMMSHPIARLKIANQCRPQS